jgi:hypothetical protein
MKISELVLKNGKKCHTYNYSDAMLKQVQHGSAQTDNGHPELVSGSHHLALASHLIG